MIMIFNDTNMTVRGAVLDVSQTVYSAMKFQHTGQCGSFAIWKQTATHHSSLVVQRDGSAGTFDMTEILLIFCKFVHLKTIS